MTKRKTKPAYPLVVRGITPEVRQLLQREGKAQARSMSGQARWVLTEWAKQHEQKHDA